MRRPALLLCFAEISGMIAAYYLNLPAIIALSIFCICFLFLRRRLFSFSAKKGVMLSACVLLFMLGALLMLDASAKISASMELEGSVTDISGTVISAHPGEPYAVIVVKCSELGGVRNSEKILIKVDPGCDVYDLAGRELDVRGEISVPDSRRNPGCFDYSRYLKSRGIYSVCSVSRFRFSAGKVRLRVLHALSVMKGRFLSEASEYLDRDQLSLMAGMLFGEKEYMDDGLLDSFRKNGIAHVLAVSGLHVGLLYSLASRSFGNKDKLTSMAVILIVAAYTALADFSVSSLRASLMILMHIVSFHIKRRYDLLSAASVTAALMLALSPMRIFDAGTQLSFMAAYTIAVALPWARLKLLELSDRFKKGWILSAGGAAAASLLIQLGIAPLTMFHFLCFSPAALFLNPPVIFFAGLLLSSGLCFFAAFTLSGGSALFMLALAGPAGLAARSLLLLNRLGTASGLSFDAPAPPFGMLILWYMFFFWFFSESRCILWRKGRGRFAAAVCTAMIAAGSFGPRIAGISKAILPWDYGLPAVTFVDVGQGDCIHIHCGSKDVLIDGGGSRTFNVGDRILKDYLLHNGVTQIDLAAATHMDSDHALGLQQLAELFDVEWLALPGTFSAGDRIYISEDVFLDILWPMPGVTAEDSENGNSLVAMLDYKGVKLLFTGDLGEQGEAELLKLWEERGGSFADCDVLKAAHHGSRNSSSELFLNAVRPEAAVISCGRDNPYGHPHQEAVERLRSCGTDIFRTDTGGAVMLRISRGGYCIANCISKE